MYSKLLSNKKQKINKIVHAADIHIRNISRHQEYKKIFKQWFKDLEENIHPDLIVLCGDIVHSKTNISPEVVQLVFYLFQKLSSIADTIVIPGNHDVNLSNLKRVNVLKLVDRLKKIKNLYLLEKSGIYTYNNIDFYHLSILDKNHPKKIKNKEQTNIALWHGTIDKSSNKYGYKFRNNIDKEYFKEYDYTFLGDIHKRQKIDNKEWIQYPGSLISQNFGESPNKGYLVWDFDSKQSHFRSLPNENTFYTLYAKNGKITEIEKITAKRPRIRIFFDEESIKEKTKLINKIKKKCKPIELSVHEEFDEYSTKIDKGFKFRNFYDIKIQNKLLKEYLKARYPNIKKEEIQKVLSLNKEIGNILDAEGKYTFPKYNLIWNIKKIEFSNFFRFGKNNKVDFNSLKGVTGIFGKNNVGKSSVFEVLFFALYGRTQKKINLIDIVNENKLHCQSKIYLSINNIDYIIKRNIDLTERKTGKKDVCNSSVNFYKIDSDNEKIKLNEENKNHTEKKIRRKLGKPNDFLNTSMIPQSRTTKFIQSVNHRKKLLSQMIGLEAIEKKYYKAKRLFRNKEVILDDLMDEDYKGQFSKIVNDINGYNEKIKKYKNKWEILNNKVNQINDDINKNRERIKNLDSEIIDIDKLKDFKKQTENSLEEKNNEYDNVTDELESDKKLMKEKRKKLDQFNEDEFVDIEDKFNKWRKKLNKVNRKIEKTQYIVKNKIRHVQILKDEPWHLEEELCKTCSLLEDAFESKNKLENKYYPESQELIKQKKGIKKKYNKIKKLKNCYKNYKDIKNNINNYKHEIKIKNLTLSDIKKEQTLLKSRINNSQEKIELYNKNKKIIEKNITINKEIKKLKTLKKSHKELRKEINDQITDLKATLKSRKDRKEEIIKKLDKIENLNDECCYYRYYIDAMNKDNIPLQIIKQILPQINRKITNILEGTVSFSIRLDYDDNDNLSIILVKKNGTEKPIEAEGGMANVIAGIAIRIALLEISALPKSTCFAIDEQFSAMDAEVLSSISNLFVYIKEKFKNVLMITHINSLKDEVDTVIEISDKDKYSYVRI